MSLFDDLDLGAGDYRKEQDPGLNKFVSKPVQKPYQPFGGPIQKPQQSFIQEPVLPEYEAEPVVGGGYQSPLEDDLDLYEQAKKQYSYLSRDVSSLNASAKLYEGRYDDFKKSKFLPFYKQFDEFGDFETDDEYAASLDSLYQNDLKSSQEEDGFFGGESDNKKLAKARLGKFAAWNQPNGLRDQFLRLKKLKEERRALAEQASTQKTLLMERMTALPMQTRMAMDEALSSRGKSPKSRRSVDEMLNQFEWESPVVDMNTGEVTNLDRVDPRRRLKSVPDLNTGEQSKSYGAQRQRLASAMKGDIQGVLAKRDLTAKERNVRDKGVIFSQNGLMDGRPLGLSRQDVDLLDIEEMKKAGVKSYKGRPIEEVLNDLGGEERLEMSKVMQAVYAAKSNFEDAQLEYLKFAGGKKAEAAKKKMEAAREAVNKTVGLSAQYGLDNELFEQAETTGWFAGIGNAIKRGMLMSEMSNYTPDFLTNTLDADEIQKFIEIASEIEEVPESSAVARYKKAAGKSEGLIEAIGNIVFNHTDAIPELFVESLASFLPATFKWGLASAGAGGVIGGVQGLRGGTVGAVGGALTGASLGARAGWAAASFTLETSGTVLEGMQDLGIDWKNPKVFAAAWNNETTRNAIVKRAVKKGVPIALMDGISAGMAGKMSGLRELGLNGGKLIDGASFSQNLKYASAAAPRFTKWQKTGNVATEVGGDSALGMMGEYFGQAWSKEPGEAWDWDSIAAEGVIGVGPGVAGGFMEQKRGSSKDFTTAPIQYSDQRNTPDGTAGTVNRAGFKTPYQTYNSADGMTSGILNMAGIDSENMNDSENATKVMAVQDWIANMWISNPDRMANLRVVVADRTPFADTDNQGSFEVDDDGNGVIYMNRAKFNQDPIGAFMHEAGHLARLSMFSNDELVDVYNGLTPDEKLSAFAEYYRRRPGSSITDYSEKEQAEIKKAYRKFIKEKGEVGAADEWFSFQFVRLLAGGQVDKSVKSDMQGWLKKFAFPYLQKFAGSEKLAGSKKDILSARILSYMGRTPRGMDSAVNPNLQAPDMPGTETDFSQQGVRAPRGANVLAGLSDSEGLNHLVTRISEEYSSPQEQARAADALNIFLAKNVLPTNISFWTKRERQNAADVQSENQKGPKEDRTFGESLPQEQRALDELLARGRVEQMTEADFAEPDVTEFSEETDPKKKREAQTARRKRQGSKKDSVKYPEGFDSNDTGARVGRSPRNIAREKEQFSILGKRFRVTLTMPGFRGDESRVEYFSTRKEAEAAVQEFEEKENTKRIKRIKAKHTKALSIIKDPAKFEEAYNKAAKKLGKDSSIHARIAEALGLSGIMSESLFGSAYSSKHLGEGKVHGAGVKGAVKAPSMREVQNDLFLSDQEHQDAVEQLSNREADLVRQIAELEKIQAEIQDSELLSRELFQAEIQGAKESTEQAPKKEEPKDTYSKVQVVQLRKNKKGQYELYSLGKGNKIKKVKNAAQTKKLLPYLRKLNETSQIEKGALAKVKDFKTNFEKQAGQYKGQLRYWLMTKKKSSGKKTKVKSENKKKEKQPSEIEAELNDIKKTLKLVRDYREVLVPESKAFMWGDLPHPHFFVDKKGTERIKLSVLAKASKDITVYDGNNKLKKENLSNPQASLADFARTYDGSKRKDFGFLNGTGLKPEEYALHVDSIMAAALNPRDLQNKPMGEMAIDKDGNQKVKEYFGGFQVDKGTNYFLYAATKAMELERSKGNFVPLVSESPTLDELAMYEVAQGKAYEDRGGDITGRNFYRYFGLVERMAKEAERKIITLSKEYEKLDPKDPARAGVMQSIKSLIDYQKKLFPSVDDIANYAEENQYFPKVQGGKMFSKAFSEWLYYDEMLGAIDKYYDYVESDIDAGQASIKEHLLIRKDEYEKALARANEGKQKAKKTQKPLFSGEFPNVDLGPNKAESDFETNKDVFYVSPNGVAGNVLRANGYDFRDIGEDPDEDIAPREGVHGGFKRRVVDQGFDILAVLRAISQDNVKGPLQERLKTLVPSSYDTAFLTDFIKPEPGTRVKVEYAGKSQNAEWREDEFGNGYWVSGIMSPNQKPETNPGFLQAINDTWMTQIDREFLKPTSDAEMVTAAEIADFLYRGKSASDLGLIPSSKNKQDRTGGPGAGLLPFVFESFIKDMYQKLNITDFETEVTVSEFIEPLASDKREFERDGKKVRLQIDANGQVALYEVNESEDLSSKLNITKKELSELTQTHFGKDVKAVAADLKSEPKAEGQKPKAEGERQYTKVKLKYDAGKWFVNGELVERSLFAESGKHSEFDYMQSALAPIVQAVIDARRVDLFGTSKRNENLIVPRDTQRAENESSDLIDGDAPEGVLDNTEKETDTTKDQAKTVQGENEEAATFENPRGDENAPLQQSTSTQADAFASKLSGTDTNKRLYNLKKGRKQALDLLFVVKQFKNDSTLWEAFEMPTPKMDVMDAKPFDSYIKDIKKHPNYAAFEARILSPGTQALGSSYALSSSIPDNYGKLSTISKLASKAGVTEEDKEKFLKKLENFDFMTALIDQADPPKRLVSDFLQSIGIKDQALIDAIDVHGKWHQYYGKGMNTVEQSQAQFIEPIKEAMAKHGLDNEVFGEYLLARAAPSRNLRLKEMYETELKDLEKGSAEYKSIKKLLEERGDSLSGINTKDAIDRIKEMEAMEEVKNFIADESNPLQLFYDMNREALQLKSESGLIRAEGDIQEMKAMIIAMSKYNINNISKARMRDNYNYAPMQGFEGETEKLFDNEMAYEAVGKSSTSSGRGWDQPKHAFLQKGAFGRTNTNVGPDPETVFAAAQEQYFDAAIRSHKNEVSNAFGLLFNLMRAIAYSDKDSVELPAELQNLSPEIKAKVKAEFDEVFQKEFKELDIKKDYTINEKQVQVNGEDVAGLKMVRKEISTKFQNDPYVFVYRKNGEPHLIQFKKTDKGARMAASLKNLRYESLPRILQLINRMTRFMAQMFTSMNPAFIIPNFIRDLGTAAIHLSEDDKKNMVGKTLGAKRLGGFMKAIFKAEQALSKGEGLGFEGPLSVANAQELLREGDHVKMYQFAKAAGAKIGMFRHKSIPELIDDLRKNKVKSKTGVKARLRNSVQLIESMNTAVENSIRQSAFWSAIETGRSVSQAATISRNVTVDFNQKGNLTQAFGSLFVFFGASMNSAHRFARTLNKRGLVGSGALIGGIVGASFLVALFNRLVDDDEDEEMPDYDTITSFKRDTNLLLPLPGNIPGLEDKTGRDTGYFGIPLPLGYNVFWALGQTTADFFAKYVMGRGGSGAMDFMTRNLDATMNAFNPIGGATLATALVPTAGKPIVEMYANKNFMGSEIRKSDLPYETPKPAHRMDQKRTQEYWTDFSRFLNKVMGGDDQVKGTIGGLFGGNPLLSSKDSDYQFDLSGSQMEHLALGYLGGPGQIINMFFGDAIYPMMDDKEYNLDINKMPIANRFIRTSTYGSATRRSYYQIREAAMVAKSSVDSARKMGAEAFSLAQKKHKPLVDIMPSIKAMDGKRSKLRDMKKKIENSKDLSNSQKMQRIEELDRKELNMITTVIKKAQSLGIS